MPDRWIEHGTQDELYNECGYDATGIEEAAIEELIAKAKDKVMNLAEVEEPIRNRVAESGLDSA